MRGGIFAILFIGGFFLFTVVIPQYANAQPGAANAMCIPSRDYSCACGPPCKKGGPPGGLGCFCTETVNDKPINGKCGAPLKCEGTTGEGLGGAQEALGMLKQIMDLLKGKGGGGGGAGEMPPPPTGANNCTNYYQVTVPSSDPCAIYNPNAVSDAALGTSGISGSLLDALGGGTNTNTNTNVSDTLLKNQTDTSANSNTQSGSNTNTSPTSNTAKLTPGLSGDVRIGSAGATIIANLRQGLSEVAGFFGGSTGGASGALSAAGKLCSSRPWSGSFVSNLIPTSFFDGLCEWRGYQVGTVAPKNPSKNVGIIPSSSVRAQQQSGISLQIQDSDIPPEADIWAEPASVRLGTRTYIFWNARGVASCAESGPSFSQNSLSGGASTVPISGPTTFNIECMTSASTTIKDSVTVQIAI